MEMHVAVAILRVQEGLDYTGIIAEYNPDALREEGETKLSEGYENPAFIQESSTIGRSSYNLKFVNQDGYVTRAIITFMILNRRQ